MKKILSFFVKFTYFTECDLRHQLLSKKVAFILFIIIVYQHSDHAYQRVNMPLSPCLCSTLIQHVYGLLQATYKSQIASLSKMNLRIIIAFIILESVTYLFWNSV